MKKIQQVVRPAFLSLSAVLALVLSACGQSSIPVDQSSTLSGQAYNSMITSCNYLSLSDNWKMTGDKPNFNNSCPRQVNYVNSNEVSGITSCFYLSLPSQWQRVGDKPNFDSYCPHTIRYVNPDKVDNIISCFYLSLPSDWHLTSKKPNFDSHCPDTVTYAKY